jgi:hypothetical protein
MTREFSEKELLISVLKVLLSSQDSGGLTGDGIFWRLQSQEGIELDEDGAFKRLVPMIQNLEKQGYVGDGKSGFMLTDNGIDYAKQLLTGIGDN